MSGTVRRHVRKAVKQAQRARLEFRIATLERRIADALARIRVLEKR